MKCTKLLIECELSQPLETALMFNIATERVNGTELIAFNLVMPQDEKNEKKLINVAHRLLKKMKAERKIQFYATEQSFESNTTEAQFLYNKYPEIFENRETAESGCAVIYVKL